MAILPVVLLALALACFILAAVLTPEPPRLRIVAAGLACWVLSILVK